MVNGGFFYVSCCGMIEVMLRVAGSGRKLHCSPCNVRDFGNIWVELKRKKRQVPPGKA